MEALPKRPRISRSANMDGMDPDLALWESRARNDLRLKSTFEAIFRKYGQDFTGIGDEVDLESGGIVVNNGHILAMRSEQDVGNGHNVRNEDLRAFKTAFGEENAAPEASSKPADGLRSCGNDRIEDDNALVDVGVQSDDDLDSLLGSREQDACIPSEISLQKEDIWNAREEAGDETHWDDSVQPRELPSEQAILCQFGPKLGPQIARLVLNVRTANDSPVEEAWRLPDLEAAPPSRRPILTSLLNLSQERSISPPNHTSIWASARPRGRPRKDESNIFKIESSPSGGSPTKSLATWQSSSPQEGESNSVRELRTAVASKDIVNSKQRRHASQSGGLPSPEESASDQRDTEQPAKVVRGRGKSGNAAGDASYSTPNLSPIPDGASLQGPASSSLARRNLPRPLDTRDVGNEEQHLGKLENEEHLSWKQIAELYPGADSHTLVSRYYSQPPLASRMQKKPVPKSVGWTQEEEELLRHLREHTTLTYAQLVDYFPGRHKDNIKWHYLKKMPNVKVRAQKAKAAPGPPFTPQEDELLLELRGNGSLPWKDLLPRFPARSVNALTWRYYNVLPSTPLSRKRKTACAEEHAPVAPKTEDLPSEVLQTELDSPMDAAVAQVAQSSDCKQMKAAVHRRTVTPVMATPSPDRRLQSASKVPVEQHISSRKRQVAHRSSRSAGGKSGRIKTSQSRSPQFTPRTSLTERQTTNSRKARSASKPAKGKGLSPQPKTASVSLLLEASDDEDELSTSVITMGTSKDLAFTTPNGIVRQCGVGGKSCDRQFCFKCM